MIVIPLFVGGKLFGALHSKNLGRAQKLKEIIQREQLIFDESENDKKTLLEDLDAINADQNRIREKIVESVAGRREMAMARDNLTVEFNKQREIQVFEKNRLLALARFIYKVRKDGFLKFLIRGEDLSELTGRIRILYRTFRSRAELTRKLDERAARLKKSEEQMAIVQLELVRLFEELTDQENLLGQYLKRKKQMLVQVEKRQSNYRNLVREYRQVSAGLTQMFSDMESGRMDRRVQRLKKHTLSLPISTGKLTKNFGKIVHGRFGTVVYRKGIEIEAEHNTPVSAVSDGTVEYSGWVKGLGRVLIVHHGGGVYSLCGHLFKIVKEKGAAVARGETIGYVGDTGSGEGAGLYFEIRENGKAVNPIAFFSSDALKGIL